MKNNGRKKKPITQAGFTLIEVLIALSVVAIGLTAVLNASYHAGLHAEQLQNKIIALWVLENKIAEIRLSESSLRAGINQGQEQQTNQAWKWQTKTESTPNPKIKKIKITILPPILHANKEPLLEQNIYLKGLK